MGFFSVEDIFRETTQTVPSYKGIKLRDLDGDGKILVSVSEGAERSRSGREYSFAPVRTWEFPEGAEAAAYPFEMMAGRSMFHFGSTSTRSKHLLTLCPQGYVEINLQDAEELDVVEGLLVEVSSPAGSFKAPARISDRVSRGMVFVPSNFRTSVCIACFRRTPPYAGSS